MVLCTCLITEYMDPEGVSSLPASIEPCQAFSRAGGPNRTVGARKLEHGRPPTPFEERRSTSTDHPKSMFQPFWSLL